MFMTKSRKRIIPRANIVDFSKQACKSTLPTTTPTIKSTMKFDSALQYILYTVLKLRQEHCIWLCFDNDNIRTLQDILSLERDAF